MLRFNDIADRVLEYDPGCDLLLLQRAYVYSAKVHHGQERLSGEPYLIHPLEVAGILVDMRMDEVCVSAGLLHDTVEDTLASLEEIERLFGDEVAFLVEGLTKIAKIEFTSVRERQAENFRKMLLAMSKDIRILLIKLADRLHNMRTLKFMSEDSRNRIALETLEIYAPLAHRLGIHWMKQELEELAFRAINPAIADDLEGRIRAKREDRDSYIEEVIGILSRKLSNAGVTVRIHGRLKDLNSIHAKMESQGITLDEIHDVIAFRIIIDGAKEEVYTALGIAHSIWRPVAGRFKDYVAMPKPNNYQSLHTTVIGPHGERMEIQIRTEEMHRSAELGIAAHWKYKEGELRGQNTDDEKFAWLRQLLEWHQDLADPHEFLETVKVDLFPEEVFVFTPTGEVIALARGSTPVDFAFAIHSEVGAHCAGAKVNGKMVPLRSRLSDGDTVEVITSPNQYPRKDWLDFVITGKARSRIRTAIRATERARSVELGRTILEKELRKSDFTVKDLQKVGVLAKLGRRHGGETLEDLYSAVSYGRISGAEVVRRLRGGEEPEPTPDVPPKRRLFWRSREPASTSGIRVSGQPDVMVRFGLCCSPLPGDEVIGFVTRGRGVTVHQKDCPKIFELDPDRRIDAQWELDAKVPRKITVRVRSVDQKGLLAKVTKTISSAAINIGAAKITTSQDQKAIHTFDLWVTDVDSLNAVMKQIGRIKGVLAVERVRS
jgi:guanosine-3',5'-bis(diphosphate) 3'-pyrophosphohydrolase